MPPFEQYAKNSYSFMVAQTTVRIFYAFLFYTSIAVYTRWDLGLEPQVKILPLWPIKWITLVDFSTAFLLIRGGFLVITLLTSLFPQYRLLRALSFVALLEFVSLYMTVLKADVDWHAAILAAFLLIFLPDDWNKFNELPQLAKKKFLFTFWAVQVLTLLTYTMAGIGKILGFVDQLFSGQVHFFAPKAAALHIADRMIVTNSVSPLGPWIIDHYLLAWPFFVAPLYFMIFAFWAAFRPRLHQFWGLGLILFHVASYLTMNIGFFIHNMILAMFLLNSPFRGKEGNVIETSFELPLFGWLLKKIIKR
jgi:hypothetical protein